MDDEEEERITSRPYGKVQVVRGRRKLFGRERQQIFLEHLAATCNVSGSAAAAGVTPQCVYQRRKRDAEFLDGWWKAVELAYARLELRLLAESMGTGGIDVRGDLVLPDEPLDKDLALHLLREHKRGLAGARRGAAPELRGADWSEVEGYFIARLRALKVRLDGVGDDPSTIRSSAEGSPPRGKLGEELL